MQRKVYFVGGGGTTSPDSNKILDISVLHYPIFVGMQGEIVNCQFMFEKTRQKVSKVGIS